MSGLREVSEGVRPQGPNESISYSVTTTPWGDSPTNVVVSLYDISSPLVDSNITATNTTGATSVSGNVISTPHVTGLTLGRRYRLDMQFVTGGNTYEAYAIIECE